MLSSCPFDLKFWFYEGNSISRGYKIILAGWSLEVTDNSVDVYNETSTAIVFCTPFFTALKFWLCAEVDFVDGF